MTWAIAGHIQSFLDDRRRVFRMGVAASLVGIVVLALVWNASRWRPPPSIFDTPIDNTLGYLTMDDFSKLPLEERIRFMMELAERFRGLKPGESAAMAAFLAAVSGPAREQLRDNMKTIAKDVLADGAQSYMALPPSKRGEFLDGWIIQWQRKMEKMATGKDDQRTDSQRLDDMRKQEKRNQERQTQSQGPVSLSDRGANGLLDLWRGEIEGSSTPKEQGQITKFLDDMRTRFANQR